MSKRTLWQRLTRAANTEQPTMAELAARTRSGGASRRAKSIPSQIGTTGLNQWSGFVQEDFLTKLTGLNGRRTWWEMSSNDPAVGAMLFAVDKLVRGVKWNLIPAEHPKGEAAKELVESAMGDMDHPWEEFISEVMSMLTYGFALFEPVYKVRDDGKIGWERIPIRAQITVTEWVFDDNGRTIAAIQEAPPNYKRVELPMDRLVNFRTTSVKDNPEGISALRNSYRPWFYKKLIEDFEAIRIERNGPGLPIITYPPEWNAEGATADELRLYEELQEIGRRVRTDDQAVVMLPALFDDNNNPLVSFVFAAPPSTGGKGSDTGEVIARKNMEILIPLLADFVMLGHESSGSWALADNKTKMFAVAIGAWLQNIAATINRTLYARLMDFNAIPLEATPTLEFSDIETPDIEAMAKSIAILVNATVLNPDSTLEEHMRRLMGLPEADFDAESNPPPVVEPEEVEVVEEVEEEEPTE